MKQNHSSGIDSVSRNRRNRRRISQEKSEKSNQSQTDSRANNSTETNRKSNSQIPKKENTKEIIRTHFDNLLNCLKSNRKKQYLLRLAGVPLKIPDDQNETTESEKPEKVDYHDSFIKDFFFDMPQEKPTKSFSSLQSFNETSRFSNPSETRLDKKIGQSYYPIQRTRKYGSKNPHFTDFVCNSLYKSQALGGEGENKKVNDSKDLYPQPADYANSILSEKIDMHSIKIIKFNRLLNDFYHRNTEKISKIAKSHSLNTDQDILNYIVMKKIHLDNNLHDIENDSRYAYHPPISLSLNDPNITIPSFDFGNLQFLFYMILIIETKTTLTPHNRKPISFCLSHLIPILLSITQPVLVPYSQSDYYKSIMEKFSNYNFDSEASTSLSPIAKDGLLEKELKKIYTFLPQFNFKLRNWPCHLILPPLHVRYLIILFDLLSRFDEFLHDLPYIPLRASFDLISSFHINEFINWLPLEAKKLLDSMENGGSLTQKFYDLRNISYQMMSVNSLNIFDRESQVIEGFIKDTEASNIKGITEEFLLEKMRHDIIDQKPYLIKFAFDDSGRKLGFSFNKADPSKLKAPKKFDETYVFPNYSINILQPENDPTLVKYDGILRSNMTFTVSGSSDPSDDQFHVQFTEGSYGIICNYTDLL